MKGYRNFLIVFAGVFVIYIVAELNRPTPLQWNVSLEKGDKNPYGCYILFNRLKDIFPSATLASYRLPVYNQLNNYDKRNSAYVIISPAFNPSKEDLKEMEAFVKGGNYVFISASEMGRLLLDKLKIKTGKKVSLGLNDSTTVNFVNPNIKKKEDYVFRKLTIDEYFSRIDTPNVTVLGINDFNKPNFIRINKGEGAYFIHAAPLCFSNYFMLFKNNDNYTAGALSYLPRDIDHLFWDEYYKLGPAGPQTPLRFFLVDPYLRLALWLAIAALIVYVLFEMKRRQRIIPVITPLQNSTLDFINTISGVYVQQKNNRDIAKKKINYFLEYTRQKFFIPTTPIDEQFIVSLSRKSGVVEEEVEQLAGLIRGIENGYAVGDTLLMSLNDQIDNFYKKAK